MPTRPSSLFDLIALDRRADVPLQRQIYNFLRGEIMGGRLRAGTVLPPTRIAAEELGVGRNTVVAAYDGLTSEGFLKTRIGFGTVVAPLAPNLLAAHRSAAPLKLPPVSRRGDLMLQQWRSPSIPGCRAFHPGLPDMSAFPFKIWRRLLSDHTRDSREDMFGYHHIRGHPRLRAAIADYVSVARGVKCEPDQVLVVTGTQAALDLLTRLLLDEGDTVWMEEPGYSGARSAFIGAGARLEPLQVGNRGWDLAPVGGKPPRLIFVTPSCQWPLGRVMQMEERLRLLRLADEYDSWIIEDDYDSEYRFRGNPLPSLQGLDRSGRVIYVGTFAKTLFPTLRIGFIVVPKGHIDGFEHAVSHTGQYPSLLLQVVLADFITHGHFGKHLRRMRRLYAARRQKIVALCRTQLDGWLHLEANDTGIQIPGLFRRAMDDRAFVAAAARRGVDVSPLSVHYHHGHPRHGLILGYAAVDDAAMERGIDALGAAARDIA